MNIKDQKNQRFPNFIESKENKDTKALIAIQVFKKDRKAKNYCGIDMDVNLMFGIIIVKWHPKTMNRLIRFFRYNKLES